MYRPFPLQLAVVSLLAIMACDQASDLTSPSQDSAEPALLIQDALHNAGNEHFFWLPPMLTPAPTVSGDFDSAADPTVSVCLWSGTECLGDPVFTSTTALGLTVDTVNEWYGVDWFVFDNETADADVFRISVSASGQELGLADLIIVDKVTGQMKKTLGGDYLLLSEKNGKKYLKIRFRIEDGAVVPPHLADCSLITAGLTACWLFNGNATDGSVNSNDGEVSGATSVSDRFGNTNSAYEFDGIANVIEVPQDATLRPAFYTISAWILTTQVPVSQWNISSPLSNLYSHSTVDANGYGLRLNGVAGFEGIIQPEHMTRPSVNFGAGSTMPVTDGEWHHVAATWDGSTTAIFMDGALDNSCTVPGPLACGTVGAQPGPIRYTAPFPAFFRIGFSADNRERGAGEAHYTGLLDDIRIFNRALSPEEILTLFEE